MEFAIIIGAAALGIAANTEQVDGTHYIPAHDGAGYHEVQVNQAGHSMPCDNIVSVTGADGRVLYTTCRY